MRALITGVGGFAGRYLAHHLLACGDQVMGLGRAEDCRDLSPTISLEMADLCDRSSIERVIRLAQPEAVYHLAAQSSTLESFGDPWATISNNLQGQLNLLESILACSIQPRVLVIGSADEYGIPDHPSLSVPERTPLKPTTPYAVSKVGQDVLAYQYFAQYGVPIIRVRPFSHTGPGQDERFAIPSFAKQIAEIEAGLREPALRVGNLSVERDLTDVRDMVKAYRLALVAGAPGEVYNLGRGEAVPMRTIVDHLVSLARVEIRPEVARDRLRPTDVPRLVADTSKFQALTHWLPEIPWQVTLHDTLDYWRGRVSSPSGVS
jgi:GDP-4-dehydro-6-deoxy-D-mannose reductase